MTITDTTNPAQTFTPVGRSTFPATVGGHDGYVGFTGATGGSMATQQILTWTYSTSVKLRWFFRRSTWPVPRSPPVQASHLQLSGLSRRKWNHPRCHQGWRQRGVHRERADSRDLRRKSFLQAECSRAASCRPRSIPPTSARRWMSSLRLEKVMRERSGQRQLLPAPETII